MNGPALEDAKEDVEEAEDAGDANDDLEPQDMPSHDRDAQEKGGDGELDERRREDVGELAAVPVLAHVSRSSSLGRLLCHFRPYLPS